MVRKMKKYIKTFPLTEKEIDQMIEDITGMAEEAQERNENFERTPKRFFFFALVQIITFYNFLFREEDRSKLLEVLAYPSKSQDRSKHAG